MDEENFTKLNGTKHLILGNPDKKKKKKVFFFFTVIDLFPFTTYDNFTETERVNLINIHGHIQSH